MRLFQLLCLMPCLTFFTFYNFKTILIIFKLNLNLKYVGVENNQNLGGGGC